MEHKLIYIATMDFSNSRALGNHIPVLSSDDMLYLIQCLVYDYYRIETELKASFESIAKSITDIRSSVHHSCIGSGGLWWLTIHDYQYAIYSCGFEEKNNRD